MLREAILRRSVWVFHFNASACNGCDIEVTAAFTPRFDAERFGVKLVSSPRQADVLLVTGPVNRQALPRLLRVYKMVPDPKVVVAVGTCACTAGVFRESPVIAGPLEKYIPVDVYVYGCPPRPHNILSGILEAARILSKKR